MYCHANRKMENNSPTKSFEVRSFIRANRASAAIRATEVVPAASIAVLYQQVRVENKVIRKYSVNINIIRIGYVTFWCLL